MNYSETVSASGAHKAIVTVLVALAVLLNTVCVILTGRIAYWKPHWPNVLVVHVGVTDLCLLLLALIPGMVALYVPSILDLVHFCQYQGTVLNVWYILDLLLLVQIMFDRYFAITHPFTYSKRILNNKAHVWSTFVYVGILTLTSLIACLPVAMSIEFVVLGPGLCFWNTSQESALPVSIVNIALILTTTILIVIFVGGISVGVCSILRRAHSSENENTRSSINKTEINFAKLSIVTSVVFGATSIPFTVSVIIAVVVLIVFYFTDGNNSSIHGALR